MEEHKLLSQQEQEELEKKAQKLLEEKDSESRTRTYSGPMGTLITILLCFWTLFQLYFNTFGVISAVNLRAFHCIFLLCFTFLLYPTYKKERRRRSLPPVWDLALVVLTIGAFGYLILNYTRIAQNGGRVTDFELILAGVALVLAFEAARRASGNLAILALIFLAYNWFGQYLPGRLGHNGFTLKRVLVTQFWGTQGLLGTGIGVSATYIFLFVVFGAFLKYSGFSKFINDFSLTLVGRTPGGPAKVAVLASALMGMINGSAIANVATTGTITIPLMKQTGYKKEFAGAVEAVASTGGQFCPPIMGAVGFVMAEFLSLSYTAVMLAAIIPAFLYYLGLLFAVHFEAKRLGLSGLSKENIPNAMKVLKEQGHLIIPLVVLIALMCVGYTPLYAAVIAIFATIGASWLQKDTRMTWDKIVAATVEGARGAISVGVCCVIIGVIIGTVTLTSLGLNMGYLILAIVDNSNIYITGLLVMIMSTILGMGVPGVAAYVIVQAVAVPVLIEVGVLDISAHMFCLIYACLSNITPPVAMSSYVAAGIAGSNQTKTGLLSVRLGLIGFLIPFFFLDNPVLLIGADPSFTVWESIWAMITASIGTVALVGGLEGWFIRRCNWGERLVLIAVAPLMLYPGALTDLVGLGVLIAVIVFQWLTRRPASPALGNA
ncbi:TRAP transporter permease [Flavonifractor sp. An100]|uniref:TRAP transporter permease n=1 Tax=Flavonifractor sp. An100 TaxID=1965538 RepID=UPI000B3A24DE|nr:TRAP transporter permease [Flavonifractor sp. An100]OUQ75894.1 C4-dicarboxylate ABC transporter permease [Flavonifractor sp. An100]